jgi:hypothetical protein
MLECGECTVCCSGILEGSIYNTKMGDGVPCHFLQNDSQKNCCSIYEKRPSTCKNYYCAYTQDFIPNLKRPDINGILVTVVGDFPTQSLKLIKSKHFDQDQLQIIRSFAQSTNTKFFETDFKDEHTAFADSMKFFNALIKRQYPITKEVVSILDVYEEKTEDFEFLDTIAKYYRKINENVPFRRSII